MSKNVSLGEVDMTPEKFWVLSGQAWHHGSEYSPDAYHLAMVEAAICRRQASSGKTQRFGRMSLAVGEDPSRLGLYLIAGYHELVNPLRKNARTDGIDQNKLMTETQEAGLETLVALGVLVNERSIKTAFYLPDTPFSRIEPEAALAAGALAMNRLDLVKRSLSWQNPAAASQPALAR